MNLVTFKHAAVHNVLRSWSATNVGLSDHELDALQAWSDWMNREPGWSMHFPPSMTGAHYHQWG